MLLFCLWVALLLVEIVLLTFIYSIDSTTVSPSKYEFAYDKGKDSSFIVKFLLWLSVSHYIWTNIILYHCGKYVCRAASSNWVMHIPHHFKNGLFTLFRFHMGSIIMGSALITLFTWLSSILYLIMPDSRHRTCCCGRWPRLAQFYKSDLFTQWLGFIN